MVGGSYVGLHVALTLQKKVAARGTVVTSVDPRPYMPYHPLLPEVASGAIEARHVVVPHRSRLPRTESITGTVTTIDHDQRLVSIQAFDASSFELPHQDIVSAAGAVTRTFPLAGLAEHGIGLSDTAAPYRALRSAAAPAPEPAGIAAPRA